jgi:hypothetical protein
LSKKFLYISIFYFASVSLSLAQVITWSNSTKEEVAKEFEKINAWYKNADTYSLIITHKTFEDYKTTTPFEKMTGYFKKNKNTYHSFLLGTHSIQNSNYKVVVDSAHALVMVSNPDKSFDSPVSMKDYSDGLMICKSFKKFEGDKERRIRLEFGEYHTVNSYEIMYYPEGNVKEITIYYNTAVKKDEDDINGIKKKPRLTVTLSDYKTNVSFNKDEFSEHKIIGVTKDKKLFLQANYKTYKLSDQRLMMN